MSLNPRQWHQPQSVTNNWTQVWEYCFGWWRVQSLLPNQVQRLIKGQMYRGWFGRYEGRNARLLQQQRCGCDSRPWPKHNRLRESSKALHQNGFQGYHLLQLLPRSDWSRSLCHEQHSEAPHSKSGQQHFTARWKLSHAIFTSETWLHDKHKVRLDWTIRLWVDNLWEGEWNLDQRVQVEHGGGGSCEITGVGKLAVHQ